MEDYSHGITIHYYLTPDTGYNAFYRTGSDESGHPHDHTGLYCIHGTEVLAFIASDTDVFIIYKGPSAIHFKNTHGTLVDTILTPVAE